MTVPCTSLIKTGLNKLRCSVTQVLSNPRGQEWKEFLWKCPLANVNDRRIWRVIIFYS